MATLDESGLKGFEVKVWHGIYAPKGTPAAAVERFNAALRASLKDPTIVSAWPNLAPRSCPGPSRRLRPEIDKWGALIRAAGTYADYGR